MVTKASQDIAIVAFKDAAQWESWLERHHATDAGAWLKIAKKNSGIALISIEEALDVALCYGWVDSLRKSHDETCFLQKYSRRRKKSSWSKINVDKVEALIAAGRMREPGMEEIRAAQADGRWAAAYASQKNATVPPDLRAALNRSKEAKRTFESLDRTSQYLVILRLMKATTATLRAARLEKMMATLRTGKAPRA